MQTRIDEPEAAAPGGTYVVRLPKDEVVDLPLRQPDPGQQQERKAAPGTEYIVRVQRDRVFGVPPSHLPLNMPPPPENNRRRCCSLFLLVAVIVSVAVVYLVLRSRHPAGGDRPHRQ